MFLSISINTFRFFLFLLNFISVLFPRHTAANVRDNTINLIHTLRDYLHYHIKCSKVKLIYLSSILMYTQLNVYCYIPNKTVFTIET